jgi:hypothetical protein
VSLLFCCCRSSEATFTALRRISFVIRAYIRSTRLTRKRPRHNIRRSILLQAYSTHQLRTTQHLINILLIINIKVINILLTINTLLQTSILVINIPLTLLRIRHIKRHHFSMEQGLLRKMIWAVLAFTLGAKTAVEDAVERFVDKKWTQISS